MRTCLVAFFLIPFSACAPAPLRNDPASPDYYGLEVGLVRTYRSRSPVCGKPHDHLMQKRVQKELALSDGRAVIVEILLPRTLETELHAIPTYSREVFTETDAGFGYYGLELQDVPAAADPAKIEIEVPKPVRTGTRRKFQGGELLIEAVEDVVVEAGRFAGCIRLRIQFAKDGNVFWFAPGVGMIRGYSESKGKDGRAAMEYELVELTRLAAH
jgi:hypothetical protein